MTVRAVPIERLALATALVPFVVAVARAVVKHWMPIGDAAYFTVRSRDVLTAHTPLVGAWSSGSSVVGTPVNNLGPMQLDLLAPFTKLSPYLGTAIGSAVINAACVAIVWVVVRRMFRPAMVVAVMAGTLVLMATLGLSWLIDARQQHAMVLPLYALLWLSAAMWAGVGVAVPLGVAVASLTLQTHFTYAYQSAIVLGAGVAGYAIATRRQRDRWRRVGAWSGAVGVLCWIQPLIDQFFVGGNLGDVLGPARGRPGAGFEAGVQVVAGAALVPPFWLPGSIGTFLLPHDGVTLAAAVLAVVLWITGAGLVAWIGWRRRSGSTLAVGAAGLIALVASLVAASRIPVSSFGLTPQNYYWCWSLAAFMTIALGAGLLGAGAVTLPRLRVRHRVVLAMLLLAVTVAVASWPRYPVASVAADEVEALRIARPLRSQLSAALDSGIVDDVVEIDLSRAFFGNDYPYVMLVELQRAGIEFRIPPGNTNLDRFGDSRCAEAGQYRRLLIISGRDPRLEPGSHVIASVAGMTEEELAEYRMLQAHFGDVLRSGVVEIDLGGVETVLGMSTEGVRDVLATDGTPAGGLARQMDQWMRWGLVTIPSTERDNFDRWFELEHRSVMDYQTVVVENAAPGDSSRC
jgi:hypothetical protein